MGKKIKILSIGHSYVVALNRSILREIAKDKDFEVTVAAPKLFKGSLRTIEFESEPEGSLLKTQTIDAYFTHKMHIFAYDHFQLKKLFSQGFDLVHAWEEPYIFSGYQIARIAHKTKTPYMFRTAQSLVKNYVFPFNKFEKSSFQWASGWIAGGQLVFEAMVKKGLDPKKGKILSLGVNTEQFKPFNDFEKKEVRDLLGLKTPVIGYLGRLSEEKGCDLFMEVLGGLKNYPWSFLIMGSGPYEEKILQWAKKENLEDRVIVKLFKHNEVPKILPVCDLLIAPSQTRPFWKEQFGRMIVEAFASGVPVIASDSGEIPRVVGEAGLVLKEDDVSLWTEKIKSFLKNVSSFQNYKDKGIERAREFSAAKIAEDYKTFYKNLLKN